FATAPVSRAILWLSLCRPLQNARLLFFAALVWNPSDMARIHHGQALGNKSALPAANEIRVTVQSVPNQPGAFPIGQQQNQPCPSRLRCVARLTPHPSIQLSSFGSFQCDYVHQKIQAFLFFKFTRS